MESSRKDISTNNTEALSLEFVWQGSSEYWAGEIGVIDFSIDGRSRYTIKIPKENPSENPNLEPISLPFKSEIDYLVIKNLDTLKKISLEAGIFNEKKENTRSQSRSFTRENLPIEIDTHSLKLGKHYQLIVSHQMKQKGPFWEGKGLNAVFKESGLCKQAIKPASAMQKDMSKQTTQPTSIRQPSIDSHPLSTIISDLKSRKANAKNSDEEQFFILVLQGKYEEAIEHARNMQDQISGGKMILDLLKSRGELNIDVNNMTDERKQTPLHRAAIHQQWHAYYALVEGGARSYLMDTAGNSAADYRRNNGMTIFNTEEQSRIMKDLFGDSTPIEVLSKSFHQLMGIGKF